MFRLRMLLTSDSSESYPWIYSYLQTIQANSFFSLTWEFCQFMYTNVFNDHSLKIIIRYQWSHKFFNFDKFLLTKFNFEIKYQYWGSPPKMFFWGSVLWVCGRFAVKSWCGGMISIELHMQLCGDHSSVWVFCCGFCFVFAEHFFGWIVVLGCLLLSKHLSLRRNFYSSITLQKQVKMIIIMFLWKPFVNFLMTVLFCLHVKNILDLNGSNYCFLFINYWFSYIFSELSKSSHLSLFIYTCR